MEPGGCGARRPDPNHIQVEKRNITVIRNTRQGEAGVTGCGVGQYGEGGGWLGGSFGGRHGSRNVNKVVLNL